MRPETKSRNESRAEAIILREPEEYAAKTFMIRRQTLA
jgi:hypothetical protein